MSETTKGKNTVRKARGRSRATLTSRIAVAALCALLLVALLAPWLTTQSPSAQDLTDLLAGPSPEHLLGTDELGRDIYSRLVVGLRLSILAAVVSVGVALVIGVPLGVIGGLGPVWLRRGITWLADMLFSLPAIILVLIVVGIVGKGILPAMLGLGIAFSPVYARLISDELVGLKRAPFVAAARISGISRVRLVVRHLGPSTFRPLIIQSAMTLRAAILTEAALSYLGFGAQSPSVSLGLMLKSAQLVVLDAPWQVLPPGILLFVIVLCLNLAADSFSESLNKRPSYAGLVRRARGRIAPRADDGGAAAETPGGVASDPPPTLRVTDLSIAVANGSLAGTNLVDGISFEVRECEIVAIVGESGSGKTVTALAAMGMLPEGLRTTHGSIEVGGEDIVDMAPSDLRRLRSRRIGVVFQDPLSCMDPLQTVGENLVSPLVVLDGMRRSDARSLVLQTLIEVGVADAEKKLAMYPHQLSGGIAQRIMIANALTSSPQILIADEPTSALDVTVQRRVLDLLAELKRTRGLSVLIITHDMGVVSYLADRALVLYAGRVMEQGSVAQVIHESRHRYTHALKAAVIDHRDARAPLVVVPGNTPAPGERPPGCPFEPRCAAASAACRAVVPLRTLGPRHEAACVHPLTASEHAASGGDGRAAAAEDDTDSGSPAPAGTRTNRGGA